MLRICAVSLNQTPLDWNHNFDNIVQSIEHCESYQAEIICFPEMAISSYGMEDLFVSDDVLDKSFEILKSVTNHIKNSIVFIGLPFKYKSKIYNAAAVLKKNKILGIYFKKYLANSGIYYESRWFSNWKLADRKNYTYEDENILLGDFYVNYNNFKICIEICEESWSNMDSSELYLPDISLVLNLSASNFSLNKHDQRISMIKKRSAKLNSYYLYTNLNGLNSGNIIYDGDIILAKNGKIFFEGTRFCFFDKNISIFDINPCKITQAKNNDHLKINQHSKHVKYFSKSDFKLIENNHNLNIKNIFEEFLYAQSLALFDYLRKSKAKGYMISLSGGQDSSACLILIAHMVYIGVKFFGIKSFCNRIFLDPSIYDNEKKITNHILIAIYQKTNNNRDITELAAKRLTDDLNVNFISLDIQKNIDYYQNKISDILDIDFNGYKNDIPFQNMQARIRSIIPWIISDIKQFIFITTSNRSEIATGYTTVDGDSAGGLAPLSGVSKFFLQNWLKWIVDLGICDMPSLKIINNLKPSAELKPIGQNQSDEDDLMPYDLIKSLEIVFFKNKTIEPKKIFQILRGYKNLSDEQLKKYINLFLNKAYKSQWKRDKLPLGFHIEDFNLDPKSYNRFPVLNSGVVKI